MELMKEVAKKAYLQSIGSIKKETIVLIHLVLTNIVVLNVFSHILIFSSFNSFLISR